MSIAKLAFLAGNWSLERMARREAKTYDERRKMARSELKRRRDPRFQTNKGSKEAKP